VALGGKHVHPAQRGGGERGQVKLAYTFLPQRVYVQSFSKVCCFPSGPRPQLQLNGATPPRTPGRGLGVPAPLRFAFMPCRGRGCVTFESSPRAKEWQRSVVLLGELVAHGLKVRPLHNDRAEPLELVNQAVHPRALFDPVLEVQLWREANTVRVDLVKDVHEISNR
jgi:hypothetical protein